MEITRPCVTCGKFNVLIGKLELGDSENWYVKCDNCISVTTVTHAIREDAIKQWDRHWCWIELDKANKRAFDAEAKESSVRIRQIEDVRVLQFRYEKVVDEYVKYRMLYSGTAGNINTEGRKTLMKKELSAELGWDI